MADVLPIHPVAADEALAAAMAAAAGLPPVPPVPPAPPVLPDANAPIPAGTTWGHMFQMVNMMIAASAAVHNPAQYAAAAATAAPFSNLPKAAKAPVIENYNGSVKLLRPWLNRTRGILIMLGFDLNQPFTVVYAASFLTGPAQSWYNSEADRAKTYKESAGFATFDDFASALSAKMGDPDPESKARDRLANLRQTTSVKAYADDFHRIITHLPNRHPDDLCHDFKRGLKPRIRELLVGRITPNMTWHDIRDLAYQMDDAVMSHRNVRDHSRTFSSEHRDNRPDDPMDLGNVTTSRGRSLSRSQSPSRYPTPGRSNTSSSTSRIPKLTPEIRAHLMANNGCFRCRKENAGHTAINCPGPVNHHLNRPQSPATSHGRPSSPMSKN